MSAEEMDAAIVEAAAGVRPDAQRIRVAMPGSSVSAQDIRWYGTKMRNRSETVKVRHASRTLTVEKAHRPVRR